MDGDHLTGGCGYDRRHAEEAMRWSIVGGATKRFMPSNSDTGNCVGATMVACVCIA